MYLYCIVDDDDYILSIEEVATEKTILENNEYPMAYTDWFPPAELLIVDGKPCYRLAGGTYSKI